MGCASGAAVAKLKTKGYGSHFVVLHAKTGAAGYCVIKQAGLAEGAILYARHISEQNKALAQ
jgi:hypothetical protein